MTNKVTYIIQLLDRFSAQARKIKESMGTVSLGIGKAALDVQKFGKSMSNAFGLTMFGSMAAFGKKLNTHVSLPIAGLAFAFLHAKQQMQTTQATFEGLFGKKGATEFAEKLRLFAQKTPFELTDIRETANLLATARMSAADILKTLPHIGDVAALGGGRMTEVGYLLQKIINMKRLYRRDMRMFGTLHIPILDTFLARLGIEGHKLGLTEKQFYAAVAAGLVTDKMVLKILRETTIKGGVAYQQMQKHLDTLLGAWRRLNDARIQLSASFGGLIEDTFNVSGHMKNLTDKMFYLRNNFQAFEKTHKKVLDFLQKLGLILMILGPITTILGLTFKGLAFTFGYFTAIVRVTTAALLGVKAAELALTPLLIGMVVAALLLWGAIEVYEHWDEILKDIKETLMWIKNFSMHPITTIKSSWAEGSAEAHGAFGNLIQGETGPHANPWQKLMWGGIMDNSAHTGQAVASESHITLNVSDPHNTISSIHSVIDKNTKLFVGTNMDHTHE